MSENIAKFMACIFNSHVVIFSKVTANIGYLMNIQTLVYYVWQAAD